LKSERHPESPFQCETFTYDAVGNRLVQQTDGALKTYTYDPANQLTSILEMVASAPWITTYLYDENGNQRVVIDDRALPQFYAGQRTTLTWDYENQPTVTIYPDGNRFTAVYNADHRRVEKNFAPTPLPPDD
jgi:YD repeat-containing protein